MKRGAVVLSILLFGSHAFAQMPTRPTTPPGWQPASGQPVSNSVEYDPLESFNRKVFWFNDQLDIYVLEPVATGWHYVLPGRVQTSISNFFWNLHFPIDVVNATLQGKFKDAGSDIGRFLINTTIGVAGFFDPATSLGFELRWEDFGQTLGWWGVCPGPYLVLPVLGPSNIRDAGGLAVDTATSITPFFVNGYILVAARTVDLVNTRAQYLEEIRKAKEAAFDYYTFVRNAYLQRRTSLINDEEMPPPGAQEDLYHPEGD
jgi:phospholipid-binding lipoprotein MlaA